MSHDTDGNPNEPIRVTVPGWLLDFLKVGVGVAISITTMYIRVALLESRVEDIAAKGVKAEALIEVGRGAMEAHNNRITTLETRQSFMDRSISDSLNRIESDLKVVKSDVKELQKIPAK